MLYFGGAGRGRRISCGGGCGGCAYRKDRQLRKKREE